MDKALEYAEELNRLKAEATALINQIRSSEAQLESVINSSCEQIKRAYIEQSKRVIDTIAQRLLNEEEREESKLGPLLVKTGIGVSAALLADQVENSEWARTRFSRAVEGYEMDETKKKSIKEATEIAKRRLEGHVSGMNREEFTKLLGGGRALRRKLRSMLKEEIERLQQVRPLSLLQAGYVPQESQKDQTGDGRDPARIPHDV